MTKNFERKKSKMKINILRAILLILLLLTFSIIFGFSNQDSQKSGGLSQEITEKLMNNIKWVREKNQTEKEEIIDRVESIIRKIAHFSIYTIVRNIINVICFYI